MPSFKIVDVPGNFAKTILNNGGSLTPLLVDPSVTKGTGTTNPSIFVDNGLILVNVRHVEYTLYHSEKKKYVHPWGPIQYLHKENEMVLKTNNFLGVFNSETKNFNYSKVDTSLLDVEPIWEFVGLEDARVVRWHDKLYLSGVRRDTTPHGQGRIELSQVEYDGSKFVETKRSRIPAPGNDKSYCEKNWMPVLDLPYHYVKWCNPTEVVRVDPELLTCETVFLGDNVINIDHDLRGGSQVLPYGDKHRIAITHQVDLFNSRVGRKDARYLNRFIVWDLDWNVVRVSEPFDFLGADVEFTCGAAWAPESENLLVTFGYQDNSAFLIEIPKSFLDKTLDMGQDSKTSPLLTPVEPRKPKVIDYFPYFNEEEILELRVRTLEDKVDQFVIAESFTTFTGIEKGFTLKDTIKRLGLPSEKIRVIEITPPENPQDYIEDIDTNYSGYDAQDPRVKYWVRERLQKDALNGIINDYEDDDVFIIGDCDEIIRPDLIDMYSFQARANLDKIIKVPMVLIEGRADLRVFNLDGSPASWDEGPVVCTKNHLERFTVTQLRGSYSIEGAEMVHVTHDGKRIEDAGWHFSWMGGSERAILKASALVHADDTIENLSFKTFGSNEMVDFMDSYEAKEGATNPIGDVTTVLRKYPLEELPQVLFTLPRVKNYLLPDSKDNNVAPIPVIGTAIVNGTKWVRRLIDSVDYPVDEFVIFNNNGRGEITAELESIKLVNNPFIKSIKLCHLPGNIGCPGAWNLIIKSYLTSPYWIIVNHDVAFGPGFLKAMVTHAADPETGMVHGNPGTRGGGMYDIFLIKDWVVQEFGLFDENFYPGYDEDVDYAIRLLSDPHKTPRRVVSVGVPHLHGESDYASSGSQTWREDPSLQPKLYNAREINEAEYMVQKWGPDWQTSPYNCPFGYAPVTTTTFDLNFVRRKYLGF